MLLNLGGGHPYPYHYPSCNYTMYETNDYAIPRKFAYSHIYSLKSLNGQIDMQVNKLNIYIIFSVQVFK